MAPPPKGRPPADGMVIASHNPSLRVAASPLAPPPNNRTPLRPRRRRPRRRSSRPRPRLERFRLDRLALARESEGPHQRLDEAPLEQAPGPLRLGRERVRAAPPASRITDRAPGVRCSTASPTGIASTFTVRQASAPSSPGPTPSTEATKHSSRDTRRPSHSPGAIWTVESIATASPASAAPTTAAMIAAASRRCGSSAPRAGPPSRSHETPSTIPLTHPTPAGASRPRAGP